MIKINAVKSFGDFLNIKSFLQNKTDCLKNIKLDELKYVHEKVNSLYENLEKLDKISKSNPELYKLLCKNYKEGKLDDNAFATFVDFVKEPIEDYRTYQAIKHYKNEGYKFTNIYLRTGKFIAFQPNGEQIKVSDRYKVLIKREAKIISDYIKGRTFPQKLTLYRGDDYITLKNTIIINGKYKGKSLADVLQSAEKLSQEEKDSIIEEIMSTSKELIINNKSFLSTSFTPDGAKYNKPLFFKLTTKGRIKGICPDFVPTHHIKELEFLVQKNSKTCINKIDYNNKNQWQIDSVLTTE